MALHSALACVAMTTMLSTGCDLSAQLAATTGTFDRTVTVTGPITLSIRTGAGDITVHPGPDGVVHVVGRIRAHESPMGGLSAEERVSRLTSSPPVMASGAVVRVGEIADRALSNNVSIDYEITVPRATRIDSTSGSGDQTIGAVEGPVNAETGSGDLRVGPVQLGASLHSGSGDIELLGATGDVNVQAASGDVSATGVAGKVNARTASGDIHVEGQPTGDWTIGAASGDVELRLPADAAFSLNASTGSGSVRVTHPLDQGQQASRRSIAGTSRGGGSRLAVSTASGSITID